jgi:hypothetical protein
MVVDKPRPRLYVDFNELLEDNLIMLSQHDFKRDADGEMVHLFEGLDIEIYSTDNEDDDGNIDEMGALGTVEANRQYENWKHVKWFCRIDADGIYFQSDRRD